MKTDFFKRLEIEINPYGKFREPSYRNQDLTYSNAHSVPVCESIAILRHENTTLAKLQYELYLYNSPDKISRMNVPDLERFLEQCLDDKKRRCELWEEISVYRTRKKLDEQFESYPLVYLGAAPNEFFLLGHRAPYSPIDMTFCIMESIRKLTQHLTSEHGPKGT
jgi:hypothetical protein